MSHYSFFNYKLYIQGRKESSFQLIESYFQEPIHSKFGPASNVVDPTPVPFGTCAAGTDFF